MSAFARVETHIADLDTLKKSLEELGIQYETDKKRVPFYRGGTRDVDVYLPHFRVGFNKNAATDSYDLIGDQDFMHEMDRVKQRYSQITAVTAAEAAGFEVEGVETLADGQIAVSIKRSALG